MKRQKLFLIKSLFTLGIISVFFKTYQHSLIVKRSYHRQRLQHEKEGLKKEKSALLSQLLALKNPTKLRIDLQEKQQMHAMSLLQLVSEFEVIDDSLTSTIDIMRWS